MTSYICQDESVNLLGLTPPEAAVYRALLRRPGTAAGRLAHVVGLTRKQVTDALLTLTGRGLVHELVPVRPDTVLEPVLAGVERRVSQQQGALLTARRELGELVALHAKGLAQSDRVAQVERVDGGRLAVQHRITELMDTLTFEVLAVNQKPTAECDMATELAVGVALRRRNINLRTVVGPYVHAAPTQLRHARDQHDVGDEHRIHCDPPLQMLLLDRRVVVVPIDPAVSADGALFVWSTTLVCSLVLLYESLWDVAKPLFIPGDDGALSSREAQLLELLAGGQKDEAMARLLGLSARTVRRESAALLDRLGTRTRFQAGAEAVRRGWL